MFHVPVIVFSMSALISVSTVMLNDNGNDGFYVICIRVFLLFNDFAVMHPFFSIFFFNWSRIYIFLVKELVALERAD